MLIKLVTILAILKLYSFSRLPLQITQHPESQIATEGARIQFKCEYSADESTANIIVSWLFSQNSQFINLISSSKIHINNNILTIISYDSDKHSGQYKCLINNTNLGVLSKPANLSLARLDSFDQNLNDNQIINLSEGNVAIIPCKLPYSNPSASPLFYLNDQLLPLTQVRYKIFPSGNLQILNVRQSDSGVYKCSAKNLVTNEIKHSLKRVTLKIFEPIGTKLPEIIYVPTDTNRVQIGSNLTLECVANGAPVPLVSWEKFGGILPEKRSVQIFGNLVLINVQPEDKGTYVCRAENGPGQATFKTAMVDVFEAPSILKNEEVIYAGKKTDIIDLKCPIKSRPRSEFQWFYNGQNLPFNGLNHKINFHGDKSVLTLRGNNQAGIYQCLAENEYGTAQADLLFNLESQTDLPKRPQIIMGPQNTTIYEGQSVVLLCVTSENSGSTQINWLQNDLIIEPTLMRRFEINQLLGNLRVVSVQKSDAGIYKCIASNEFGMSTAEAYVNVKSIDEDKKISKKIDPIKNLFPMSSRPLIQQIGADKILLKWNLLDSQMNILENDQQVAYFKVDYKTNKQQIPGVQPNTWLTIDEQIDPRKREYILTDLSLNEIYRFRISTYFLNGELSHSHQSAKFKLEPTWTSQATTKPTTTSYSNGFKLGQIQVQISQIWAISSTSLGLKWSVIADKNVSINKKINGFYIYYRKLGQTINHEQIPLYNYTRINVPLIQDQLIDSYLIANLEQSSQYEIKMTCFNLNGDLCSFSNPIYGLTLTPPPQIDTVKPTNNNHLQQQLIKSKQNEFLFMILGAVLGVLTLLLLIFIIMCVMRNRQHKKLLAQLHNTSHKLTSSSCPTLIYEDSLRQNNKINLYLPGSNDSNSTNSQSMSTTTSSITTPPINEHVLLLNGNTVSTNSFANLPPPIPQVPPPINPGTMNRININMNPLNGYLEAKNQQPNENFYHTLTQLGNLPDKTEMAYSEYNNATLNMRNLIIKQQQQQQLLMNTLKNLNLQAQYQMGDAMKSPSIKRSTNGSKKNKKGKNENFTNQVPQAPTNYYLLPNCLPTQPIIYNEVDLLNAALINQNMFMLNQQQNNFSNQVSSFQMPQQIVTSPVNNNLMDLFDKTNEEITNDLNANKNEQVYEQTELMDHNEQEKEPMLSSAQCTSHYAATDLERIDESNQLL